MTPFLPETMLQRRASVRSLVAVALFAFACTPAFAQGTAPTAAGSSSNLSATVKELQKTDIKQGTGAEALSGKPVLVHYTGWLYDSAAPEGKGSKFDSSRDRGEPIEFTIGQSEVIPGWEQGISGMKVGAKRTLVIPPNLAYGRSGSPPTIPANATLVFDVELTAVK